MSYRANVKLADVARQRSTILCRDCGNVFFRIPNAPSVPECPYCVHKLRMADAESLANGRFATQVIGWAFVVFVGVAVLILLAVR